MDNWDRRASGRTTRMLEEAIQLAKEGRAVYVLFSSKNHCDQMERCPDIEKYKELGIKFEHPASLGQGLDLENLRLIGAHPNCILLVDHHLLAMRYGRIFEMFHRYDKDD